MERLSKNFTWEEASHSDKAEFLGIDNTPTDAQHIANIKTTSERMEIVRRILGEPIDVNSWFRCEKLNEAVGGSTPSQHVLGLAVDFVCPGFGVPEEIVRCLSTYKDVLFFDQLICEYGRWVHIGWATAGTKGRGQVLRAVEGRTPLYAKF